MVSKNFFFFFFWSALFLCVVAPSRPAHSHPLPLHFLTPQQKKIHMSHTFFPLCCGSFSSPAKKQTKNKNTTIEYRLRVLDHPNIVHLYECFEHDDQIHLVMENCEGETFFFPFCRIPVPSSCLSLSLSLTMMLFPSASSSFPLLPFLFFLSSSSLSSSFPLLPFLSSPRW